MIFDILAKASKDKENCTDLNLDGHLFPSNHASLFEILGTFNKLTSLSLGNVSLSDLSGFPHLPSLIKLNLSGNNISSITGLTILKNLRQLDLSRNKISDFGHLEALSALPKLRKLNLTNCPVSLLDAYREMTLDMIPTLISLDGKEINSTTEHYEDHYDENEYESDADDCSSYGSYSEDDEESKPVARKTISHSNPERTKRLESDVTSDEEEFDDEDEDEPEELEEDDDDDDYDGEKTELAEEEEKEFTETETFEDQSQTFEGFEFMPVMENEQYEGNIEDSQENPTFFNDESPYNDNRDYDDNDFLYIKPSSLESDTQSSSYDRQLYRYDSQPTDYLLPENSLDEFVTNDKLENFKRRVDEEEFLTPDNRKRSNYIR
jgi:hypothetical protein